MKASFDGARISLVSSFNGLCYAGASQDYPEKMDNLRESIVALLLMHDPEDQEDCNELIDKVKLLEVNPS